MELGWEGQVKLGFHLEHCSIEVLLDSYLNLSSQVGVYQAFAITFRSLLCLRLMVLIAFLCDICGSLSVSCIGL